MTTGRPRNAGPPRKRDSPMRSPAKRPAWTPWSRRRREGSLETAGGGIGDDERDGSAPGDLRERLEQELEIGTGAFRLKAQDLANDTHDVLVPLLRGHDLLDMIGAEDEADPVVVL